MPDAPRFVVEKSIARKGDKRPKLAPTKIIAHFPLDDWRNQPSTDQIKPGHADHVAAFEFGE